MASMRVETLIQQLNPFAVQFLSLAEASFVTYLKNTYPKVEVWQSVHLPQAGETVDVENFQKSVQTSVTAGVDALLFDTAALSKGEMKFGGTGVTSDWDIGKEVMVWGRGTVPNSKPVRIDSINVRPDIDKIN